MPVTPDKISDALKTDIRTKLVAQLLRWDQGQTQELFDKKLFGEWEAEATRFISARTGHHITDKPVAILCGQKEYKDVFSWLKTGQVPRGFMVSIIPANYGELRDKVTFPVAATATKAVEELRGALSDVIAYARANKTKGLKTLRGPGDWENGPESVFIAATAEDFVNGMNVLLDKDLQINTELLKGLKK